MSRGSGLIDVHVELGPGPDVIALGAWFKNTVCAIRDGTAAVSVTVGDLDRVESCLAHESMVNDLLEWLGRTPAAVAHDLHPDFHSTRFALDLADTLGVPAFAVQHHHAHVVAVAAEHAVNEPMLGLALDGVGLGTDGTAWGGELLRVDGAEWQHLSGLRPLRLPGGDRAAREPWRMASSVLHDLGRAQEIPIRFAEQPAAAQLPRLLRTSLRCPPTSSLGRVFDAAAGLLGLTSVMTVEAEAAMALERAATDYLASGSPPGARRPGVPPIQGGGGPDTQAVLLPDGWRFTRAGQLDLHPLLASLADESDPGRGAARFHITVAAALFDWVGRQVERTGITTLAAGGGCLFNSLLRTGLRDRCTRSGLRFLEPRTLLPGDTAIALGQAVVARRLMEVN